MSFFVMALLEFFSTRVPRSSRKLTGAFLTCLSAIILLLIALITRCSSLLLISSGVINRGDSFRRRRSRSNSLAPTSPMKDEMQAPTATGPVESHLVMMLGAPGVGKAALTSQFRTSECINAYEGPGKKTQQSSPPNADKFWAEEDEAERK